MAKYQAIGSIEGAEVNEEIVKSGGRSLIWEGFGGYKSEVEAFLEETDSGFEPLQYTRVA